MDGMMGTDEDSVFEPQLEEEDEDEDDGETYFRTEHVSRTEELQEEVDLAGKVKSNPLHHCTKCGVVNSRFCRKCPFSVNFWVWQSPARAKEIYLRGSLISKMQFPHSLILQRSILQRQMGMWKTFRLSTVKQTDILSTHWTSPRLKSLR